MRFHTYATATVSVTGALALAAGGGSYSIEESVGRARRHQGACGANVANRGDTTLGKVLVSSTGRTIYALTTDTKNNHTCVDGCREGLAASARRQGLDRGPGLPTAMFGTIAFRADGTPAPSMDSGRCTRSPATARAT